MPDINGASSRDNGPGGGGPSGAGGGGIAYPSSSLPAPNEGTNLGASTAAGQLGNQVIFNEIPGDLGSLHLDMNKYLLLSESHRQNSTFNGLAPVNLRYRGHREASKFNLMMQKLVTACASLFLTLRGANQTLITRESSDLYPTDTEISALYHIREQVIFKEWLLLKDENRKWFT